MRHSAGEAPLLVVPSLRGADGVDGTTVSFLLAENLKLQKEEEKERRRLYSVLSFSMLVGGFLEAIWRWSLKPTS